MTFSAIIKQKLERRKVLREDALKEAARLSQLLRRRYEFDEIYIYGSILSGKFGSHSDIDFIIKGLKIEDFFKPMPCL